MKPRIAIIGTGMIASGVFAQGIPAFVKALEYLSTHVDIYFYSFAPLDKRRIPSFIRARYLPAGLHQRIQYFLLAAAFLSDHWRKKFVVIHAQSPFPAGVLATRLSKLCSIKCVLTLHAGESVSLKPHQFGDLLKPGMLHLTRKVCQQADILTTMSTYQATITRENLKLDRAIEILPRGVEIPEGALPAKQVKETLRIIYIANYHPVKDPEMLIAAIKLISSQWACTLTIVGDRYDARFFQRIIDSGLADCVELKGAMPHEQTLKELSSAHLLLCTSLYEALPMVAMEAMASGVAVCGTHVGILADTAGQCCLTVSPGDYRALASRVLSLIGDQELYDSLRRRAFEWVKQHEMSAYVQRLLLLYGIAQ